MQFPASIRVSAISAAGFFYLLAAALLFGLSGRINVIPIAVAGTGCLFVWLAWKGEFSRFGRETKLAILEGHPQPYILFSGDGTIVDSNGAGRTLLAALGAHSLNDVPALLSAAAVRSEESVEVSLTLSDGTHRIFSVIDVEVPRRRIPVNGIVLHDVTTQRETEQELDEQAHFDALTGLPNRRLFQKQLVVGLAKAKVNGHPLCLMLFDLDRFKEVNDSLGHDGGDALLKAVGKAVQNVVRSDDVVSRLGSSPMLGVSRLGGDEFAVVFPEIARPEDAVEIGERILRALSIPTPILEAMVEPTASIGIALFPTDGNNVETLFRAADQALYHAKDLGRNQCQSYHPALNRIAQRRQTIRSELKVALANKQLDVFYQPTIALEKDCIVGAEALLRWNHHDLGTIRPDEFVEIAETSGLASELGRYVLSRVCEDISEFGFQGEIAVNLCPSELAAVSYFDEFTNILRRFSVSPMSIHVEITERVLLDEELVASTNLQSLRSIGVEVYLDDFGTGQSSLSDLLKHTVDGIKLDRSFTADVLTNKASSGVVRALVGLAHELNLSVVAEGVEYADQAMFLSGLGCAKAQGYLWDAAMPADEFFKLFGDQENVLILDECWELNRESEEEQNL